MPGKDSRPTRERFEEEEPRSRRRHEPVEEEPRSRRRGYDDEEPHSRRRPSDEEDSPRSRRRSEEDEDSPRSRRHREDDEEFSTENQGWGALVKRREYRETRKERNENLIREFWLKSGETATIQLLNDEPFVFDGHNVKIDGDWKTVPCQLVKQRHCLMCRDKVRKAWKAAFKLWDYRGNWDKDKKRFKNDDEFEKIWLVSDATCELLDALRKRKKCELTDIVLDVTRVGSGKTTTYSIQIAEDDDGRRLKPIDKKEKFPGARELVTHNLFLSDAELEATGFESSED